MYEKIKAEIERINNETSDTTTGRTLDEILAFIDSLRQEQPEVDLEKELDKYLRGEFKQTAGGNFNNYIQVARHFYELGKNSK